jgi:hypothetical protein
MPYTWIAKGLPRGEAPGDCARKRQIHKFTMPELGEPGFYRQTTSLNAFRHGRLKGVTPEDKRLRQTSCCWAPTMLWYLEREEEWLANQRRLARNPVLTKLDERVLPQHVHASIYDFFAYIGFDRQARRYVPVPERYVARPERADIAGGTTA